MKLSPDAKDGLKHVGAMLGLFLLIVLVSQAGSWVATVLTTTAVGAGAPFVVAALEKTKAVSPKVIIGWGVIGLIAGICFAAAF